MTEQELVEKTKEGDQRAFEQLVLDNQDRIFALTFRMTGSREEGADLAQETFLRAWQSLPSFQGESSFSTWLHRLATNLCIDWLRRRKRRRAVESGLSLDEEGTGWSEPSDWRQDPQFCLEQAELGRALARGLDALPAHQRQVLVLRELSGLSYQEIGQTLELDIGTVKSRIARARLALRKILLADGNFSPPLPSKQSEEKKEGELHVQL